MSFFSVKQTRTRLNRSELAVPGSSPDFFEKAAKFDTDVIFLDLEDSVAPDDKEKARENVIKALNEIDFGKKIISVRINGLDTYYMYRDVVDVMEQGGERLDLIMIPKVGTAKDVYAVDMLVTQIENKIGRKKKIGFEMIVETALGMQNVYEIATASKRNESLHFGIADYAASTKAKTTGIGTQNPKYSVLTDRSDMWHYPLSRMVIAARAAGLRPIDGPFGEIKDSDAYKSSANRAAVLGCEGKWAIHPSQIDLANKIFTPPEEEVAKAKRILEAMKEAQKQGKGAASLDGRLIDLASVRQAEVMVQKAELIKK